MSPEFVEYLKALEIIQEAHLDVVFVECSGLLTIHIELFEGLHSEICILSFEENNLCILRAAIFAIKKVDPHNRI
jgi:hypothetical protein